MNTIVMQKERQRRIAALWSARSDDMTLDQATEAVDTEMAEEAAAQAAADAFAKTMTDSLERMWSCQSCGDNAGPGATGGLCPPCKSVAAAIRAERAATEQVHGRDRRELVTAYLDRLT